MIIQANKLYHIQTNITHNNTQHNNTQHNSMLIALLFILTCAYARHFQTSIKFTLFARNKGWVYLDKMTFAPGRASAQLTTKVTGIPFGRNGQVILQAIPQSSWQQQSVNQCNQHITRPLTTHVLQLNSTQTRSSLFFQVQQYETYYFVMKDCQKRYISQYQNNNIQLRINLHLLNNGRQVGQEEDHWYIVPFIVLAGMWIVFYYMKEIRNNGEEMDWCKMMLFAGTATQISSLIWKSFGFIIYHFLGVDYLFFHIIYLLLHSISQAAVISLIVLVAFGWTLTFQNDDDFDIFIPLLGCLAFINVIITILTKISNDHDRHHVFDTVSGLILIIFRIIIILVFLIAVIKTYIQSRHKLRQFIIKFGLLSFVYLSSMPLIVLIANYYIQAKERNEFVFISVQMIKFITNLALAYMVNYKTSEYNRVNLKNASFLPQTPKFF